MGADIHFVIEHDFGLNVWVGVYATGIAYKDFSVGADAFERLSDRDYEFFSALAGVRGPGPSPNGLPAHMSELAKILLNKWALGCHSICHRTFRDFVSLKMQSNGMASSAMADKLKAVDPVRKYIDKYLGEEITLDDKTRVIAWFDS